jgi:peptidoglycan/xylan/chitin deacetylase (PgdA/CDA1 family)
MREHVAKLLQRAGALGGLMRLKRFAPVPNLSIVTYHHIDETRPDAPFDPEVADASPAQFRRQLESLVRYCTPITIGELIRAVDGEALPPNPVMVTFDDGYRTCHDVALPILKSVGVPATFFVSTSFVSERRLYWWERIAIIVARGTRDRARVPYPALRDLERRDPKLRAQLVAMIKNTPNLDIDRFLDELSTGFGVEWSREREARYADELIMSWDQVRALEAAGMDVESHGRRHRVLQTLDDRELTDELTGSKVELEAQLGRPIRAVAYPVGRSVARWDHIRAAIAAAGYKLGFSNASGGNRLWPGPLRSMLPVDPYDVHRLSTDKSMSDAMFLTQVAVPQFGYVGKHD